MHRNRRIYLFGVFALIAAGCNNNSTNPPVVAPPSFLVTPLAANKATYGAANIDTNMQDAWGLAFNTSKGYTWIADRASGVTTVYDSLGVSEPILYHVKGPGGVQGMPTGIVQAPTGMFPFDGSEATWILSELNGTIAAVISGAQGDSTFILTDHHSNSSYTGLALVTNGASGPLLYAPNIAFGSLDIFTPSFTTRTTEGEQSTEQDFTPFNAILIDTQLFVTSARMLTLSGNTPFVATGPYNVTSNGGFVDIYNINGTFERTLISDDSLDSPWGVAIAPPNFGTYSGDLLVGNFGDGKIHAYNRSTGALMGTLNDASGAPIVINGLWALVVYNGTLYYTAGPNGGADGVFGTITVK